MKAGLSNLNLRKATDNQGQLLTTWLLSKQCARSSLEGEQGHTRCTHVGVREEERTPVLASAPVTDGQKLIITKNIVRALIFHINIYFS